MEGLPEEASATSSGFPRAPAGQVLPWLYISVNESLILRSEGGNDGSGGGGRQPRGEGRRPGPGRGPAVGGRGPRGRGGWRKRRSGVGRAGRRPVEVWRPGGGAGGRARQRARGHGGLA